MTRSFPFWKETSAVTASLKTWHAFAFLIAVAVLIHLHAHYLILIVAALVVLVRFWVWLSVRFPATMIVVNSILAALLRGGPRRRW